MEGNITIARNTVFLYIRMFFVLIVSLYISRVVLNTLGVEDFGIYGVVAGFVSIFGFLESTLAASTQRFYNYEGTKRGEEGFRDVFCSGLSIQVGTSLALLIILGIFGQWYVNNVMVVPAERLKAANFLFQCSATSLVLVMLQVPFSGMILAREKMDFYAVVSIVEVILKLAIALRLPHVTGDKLNAYGAMLVGVTLISTVIYVAYCKLHFKEMRFKISSAKVMLKPLLSFSGWTLVGTFAFLLKGQGLNMILNLFFGPIINAARTVAYQVSGAINSFSANVSTAFRPQIVISCADEDFGRTGKLMYSESRICFALIALLVTPAIIEMDFILHLWLGATVPEHAGTFTSLVLIDTLICTLNAPCTQVVYATGDIRKYQIWSALVNILLLPACYVLLKAGMSAESTFIATIIFSCTCQHICLKILHKTFKFEWREYLGKVLVPCFITTALLPVIPTIVSRFMQPSIWRLLCVCITDLAVMIPICRYILLSDEELDDIHEFISKKINRNAAFNNNDQSEQQRRT